MTCSEPNELLCVRHVKRQRQTSNNKFNNNFHSLTRDLDQPGWRKFGTRNVYTASCFKNNHLSPFFHVLQDMIEVHYAGQKGTKQQQQQQLQWNERCLIRRLPADN